MGQVTLQHAQGWMKELDRILPTKKAKKDACSRILNDHDIGSEIRGLSKVVLYAVFANHNCAAEKFGEGVERITIEPTERGQRGFYLHRVDGTSIDISYIKAITTPESRQDVADACRRAIEPTTAKFRAEQMAANPTCAITGWPLTDDTAHVHHAPPMFDTLVDSWLETFNDLTAVADHLDRSTHGVRLTGRVLSSWRRYHDKHACLQLVHETANVGVEGIRRKIGAS